MEANKLNEIDIKLVGGEPPTTRQLEKLKSLMWNELAGQTFGQSKPVFELNIRIPRVIEFYFRSPHVRRGHFSLRVSLAGYLLCSR